MVSAVLTEQARRLLGLGRPAVLTTLNPDGSPQSTPVWVMLDEDEIVMSTLTKRSKYRNVRRDPRVSVVLLDPDDPIRYVTVSGSVVLEQDADKTVLNALSRLYLGTPYPIDEGAQNVRVTLRLTPQRVLGQTEAAR